MSEKIKEYSNGELTVVWKPHLCIHAGKCVAALPEVYNPNERPWIKAEQGTTQALKDQIATCPSGALSYYLQGEEGLADARQPQPNVAAPQGSIQVDVMKDGPLLVYGDLNIKGINGEEEQKSEKVAFCRCGASGNKPYCDGSHQKTGFKD